MDEKCMADVNLRGEDVQNLRQMLEYRFPPPNTARQPPSIRSSKVSVLDREEKPWWWSPSVDTQCSEHESRVLDSGHLLSSEMLARSLALSAQRTRDKLYTFVQALAKQRGEDYDEMIDAWDGFGLEFMPRIPKQPGNPPDASYFYKAKLEKDIQNIHIVLQYFAVLLEEILHDHDKFNSPMKNKWQEVAEMLRQLLREVDVVLVTLELPRRRVPRAAIPEYARGLALREARDARDWLAARDLLNAIELLWHVFSVFAAAADARRESQLRSSATALARYGSNYNCARHPVSSTSLRRDLSASQIILPYARLSPVPGRPSGATRFLYGLARDPMSTPFSSPAAASAGRVDFDAHFPPHAALSAASSQPGSPPYPAEVYLSFDLPHSISAPSSPRRESPLSAALRHRLPRTVFDSSSPQRVSPPYADEEPGDDVGAQPQSAGAPTCCMPPLRSPFANYHPDLFSPPAIGSRSPTLTATPKNPTSVATCCLPPPKPQLPPPVISRLVSH